MVPPTEASHNKEHKHQEHMRATTFKPLPRKILPQVAAAAAGHVLSILGNNEHNLRIMSQHRQAVARPHLRQQRGQNVYQ